VPDLPGLYEEHSCRQRRAEPSRAAGRSWQVIVAENAAAAHIGLQREYDIADKVGDSARGPAILIWRSARALIVARGQTRWPNFEGATGELAEMGWPVLVRTSGGGAFPISPGTVQVAMIARYADLGMSMDGVYEQLGLLIASALAEFGILVGVGTTPGGAFCEGRHDLVVAGRKIAGLAQHWGVRGRGERCVTGAASVLVDADINELVEIVDRFHAACGRRIDIRPEAVTTVRHVCDAGALSHRDLSRELLARLAIAASRLDGGVRPLWANGSE